MTNKSGKQIAVERPLVRNRTVRDELLVATDDGDATIRNIDSLGLIQKLGRVSGKEVRIMGLAQRISVGWLRRSWTQLAEVGAVHLQLSQTSLLSVPVVSLLIAARFFGRTTSVVIAGPLADLDGDSLRRQSFVLRLVDNLAVQSPYLYEQLLRHNVKASLLPAPISDRWFLDRRVDSAQPVIMWAGDRDEQSHLEVAVRAYQTVKQKYPRAELLIACPGGEAHAAPLGDNLPGVQFVDSARLDKLGRAYTDADIFVNTSIVDSQPVAVLRALASGLPVITAAVGSLRQLIEDGDSGILVPLDSHARYADSIIDLVETEGLALRLSQGSLRLAQEFRFSNGERSWRHFLGFDS